MRINFDTLPAFWPDTVAVDTETTGLDPHKDHLLSVAVYAHDQVYLYLHTSGFKKLKPLLEDPGTLKVFQNAKFDMKFFLKRGMAVNNIYDTMLADQVLEMGKKLPMDLTSIAARRAGEYLPKEVRQEFINHPGFDKQPLTDEQRDYMANDVVWLPKIREEQLRLAREAKLTGVFDVEFAIVPAIVELEFAGLRLDSLLWFEQVEWFKNERARLEARMREIVGDYTLEVPAVKKGVPYMKQVAAEKINFNSHHQLRPLLNNRFGMPVDSTNKILLLEAVDRIEDEDPDLPEGISPDATEFVLAHIARKHWGTLMGYDYAGHVNPLTQRVHPDFRQLGARTGRFSCKEPNMQNVPKPGHEGPNMRRLWMADDDESVIVRADYAQQEARIMAHMSGDKKMIQACNTEDMYIACAEHMYGRIVDKKSDERQFAKVFVLSTGFGAGSKRLHKASGLPVEECERIKGIIQDAFPVMARYGQKMFNFLKANGYIETALGRRRYIDKAHQIFTEAVNTPIQGTAADMFKLALANIHSSLTEEKKCGNIRASTRVYNLVHDELEIHCHETEVDRVYSIVKEGMEKAGNDLCPTVKHVAELAHGPRWDK